jgi:aspartate/tyrosine/aromatic aminotransferase
MVDHWHVYLLPSGRISMAGINTKNVKYVAEAMNDCVKNA